MSDIHLPTYLADAMPPHLLANKRLFSWLSWFTNRRHIHKKSVTDSLVKEVLAAAPDHIMVTGDLINLSLPAEYERAVEWLHSLGPADTVSAIPGNHDLVVDTSATRAGMASYAPFMRGDDAKDEAGPETGESLQFPYARRRGDVVFIGLSTAMQTPIGWCSGALIEAQGDKLRTILQDAGRDNLCRIIALHHPPAGPQKRHGGLEDNKEFAAIISEFGAELILHGHTHRPTMHTLKGPKGPVPVMGICSLSVQPGNKHPTGCWNEYSLYREGEVWKIDLKMHRYAGPDTPSTLASQILL